MATNDGNQVDLLGEGTADPFGAIAPGMTPEDQQRQLDARRAALRAAAARTSARNLPSDRVTSSRFETQIDPRTGKSYTGNERPATAAFGSGRFWDESWKTVKKDPWLLALPAAPLTMAALAPGAAGAGTIAGSSAPEMAFAGASGESTAAAEAAMNAAHIPAAASGAAPVATAATATTPTLGSMVGADLSKYAGPAAIAAAPAVANKIWGGRTDEQKDLIKKGEEIAAQLKVRQGQQQDARMHALGQQMLAFNPTNKMMAQIYGPGAAFQPEQMAQMAQGTAPAPIDPSLINYKGGDPKKQAQVEEWIRRQKEFEAAEAARRDMIMNNFQAPGPGPAPMQMPSPTAAKRY